MFSEYDILTGDIDQDWLEMAEAGYPCGPPEYGFQYSSSPSSVDSSSSGEDEFDEEIQLREYYRAR